MLLDTAWFLNLDRAFRILARERSIAVIDKDDELHRHAQSLSIVKYERFFPLPEWETREWLGGMIVLDVRALLAKEAVGKRRAGELRWRREDEHFVVILKLV